MYRSFRFFHIILLRSNLLFAEVSVIIGDSVCVVSTPRLPDARDVLSECPRRREDKRSLALSGSHVCFVWFCVQAQENKLLFLFRKRLSQIECSGKLFRFDVMMSELMLQLEAHVVEVIPEEE